ISAAVSAQANPGNTVFVKPGIYREQVSVPRSGLPGSPFVIQATGPGVTVEGADDFSNPDVWNFVTGDVWLAPTINWSVQQVFVDGTRLTLSIADPGFLPPLSFRYIFGSGLFVNAGGGNPGAHVTLVGHRPYGFRLGARSWVSIDGFTVSHHEAKGFYLNNA